MARSIATIKQQMIDYKSTQTALSALNSTSATAIFNLIFYNVAVCVNLFEQLLDIFKADIEEKIKLAAPGTEQWLQERAFEFQYSATNPQVLTIIDDVPQYATVDEDLRIISRCSVTTTGNRTALVKVATGEPPAALSTAQLNAFQDYLSNGGSATAEAAGIGFAGVDMIASSTASDKFFLEATITYAGQFASVIEANVIDAINEYLANIDFNGEVRIISLVDAIQSVEGVVDINIVNAAIRADSTAFASKTFLIQSSTTLLTSYPTFAGYVVEETTAGETFADKLTFTPAS